MSDSLAVSREWLAANNEAAKYIPRGTSTPESRLEVARKEYENLAARANAAAPTGRVRRKPSVTIGEGAERTVALTQSEEDRAASAERLGTHDGEMDVSERAVLDAYGAGRAYERAIQEARGFTKIDVGILRR